VGLVGAVSADDYAGAAGAVAVGAVGESDVIHSGTVASLADVAAGEGWE
jgi:hypothetical protein